MLILEDGIAAFLTTFFRPSSKVIFVVGELSLSFAVSAAS